MSIDVFKASSELASQGKSWAMATVVRVEGSSSARPGSRAVIASDGRIVAGWVGGGCAESAVRHQALHCLKTGKPQLITLDMTDELLGVGMPCGGVMEVFIDPVLPQPELLLVGHGRIAETLASLGSLMGYSVVVDDPGATGDRFPTASRVINDDLTHSAAAIGERTCIVVATQHKLDHLWIRKALDSGAAYIALIASRHRAALVLDYLVAEGVPQETVDRVWAPAGLDLGAATPEEIALSIMSQIVALRRGGSMQPLKQATSAGVPEETDREERSKVIREC